jgi:hypothetical protein
MPTPPRPRSRATVFLTVASLVALTVLFVGIAAPAPPAPPRLAWHLFEDHRVLPQGSEVAAGAPIGVTVELPFPAHVYVASWSALQGTIALFPSDRLSTELRNPLPPGAHWLPATLDGERLTWPTHAVVGPIHYLTLVSRQPLPDLEERLQQVKQMGHMAKLGTGFADRGMYVFAPSGGMRIAPPNDAPAAPELEAARAAFTALPSLAGAGELMELPGRPGVFAFPYVVQGR